MPMFPFHTWLPEAHVQAPTEGSVILASLLLKLGGYGFIRIVIPLTWNAMNFFYPLFAFLSICGIVFCSMSACIQLDLKKLIAYSSVAHMNLVVLGIFSLNLQGIQGSIFLMVAHGIVSSGLFFLIGFLYDRHLSRSIPDYSGLVQAMPNFVFYFFIFTLANVSFPLTANFIGELLILVGIVQKSFLVCFCAATGIILSAIYSFWAFGRISFLTLNPRIKKYQDLFRFEEDIFIIFMLFVFLLGIFPGIVLHYTEFSVRLLLAGIVF